MSVQQQNFGGTTNLVQNATSGVSPLNPALEEVLEKIAEELQVPDSRYEAAERSYHAVADWLSRPESSIARFKPDIYIQGSFRLGTAIKPYKASEDYDVDLVCSVELNKEEVTQQKLKSMLGSEIKAYAKSKNMASPEERRRCWTLNYADGAQFHLDTLPAIPDGASFVLALKERKLPVDWADMALAITDTAHENYSRLHKTWPHSNPRGYAEWFKARMSEIFNARRQALAKREAKNKVEDIPEYRVRTPLQQAIQILKRHRDMSHDGDPDDKPPSILITTLAARAYGYEDTISETLLGVLTRMENFIENRGGVDWVQNPTDPQENFADKWQTYPQRREAFYAWLERAKTDFYEANKTYEKRDIGSALAVGLGHELVEVAVNSSRSKYSRDSTGSLLAPASWQLLNPSHKQGIQWPMASHPYNVTIKSATVKKSGRLTREIKNDDRVLPKNCSITFNAETNVPGDYVVHWQVVNTGPEAKAKGQLRGNFDGGIFLQRGVRTITHNETTLYRGAHSIECFIVKDGVCVAKSGQFIVNIA